MSAAVAKGSVQVALPVVFRLTPGDSAVDVWAAVRVAVRVAVLSGSSAGWCVHFGVSSGVVETLR